MRTINETKRVIKTSKELGVYRSELLQAQTEVDYFLKVLKGLKTETIGNSSKSLKVAEFVQDFHHFKRLIKRFMTELNDLHHDQAKDTQNMSKLDSETFKDHQYFKGEMTDFETNFKESKYLFRAFVTEFDYLTPKP